MGMKILSTLLFLFWFTSSPLFNTAIASDSSNGISKEQVLVKEGIKALHENRAQEALKLFRQAKTTSPNFAPAFVG